MKHAGIIAGFLLGFVFLAWGSVFEGPYIYDEADYLSAAARGPLANAFDTGTMPLPEFLRLGLGRGRDPNQKTTLSESVRNNNDIVFYRHWHGPVLFYWLTPFEKSHTAEQVTRASMLAFPLLLIVAVYLGSLRILPPEQRQAGALITTALTGWNFAAVKASEVAPHQAYALAAVCSLLLLCKAIASGERKYWYLSVAAAAMAFATLEVAFVLVLTLFISAWVERKWLLRCVGVFVGTVLLLWPGAVLKLSFLKAYFFLVYLSVFRKAAWGDITLWDSWRTRLTDTPLDWILLLVCLVAVFKLRTRIAYPLLVYGILMVLTVGRVATYSPRYSLPFLPAFDLFIGFVFSALVIRLSPTARTAVTASLCLAAFLTTWFEMRAHPLNPEPRPPALLAQVRDQHLESGSLLVPQIDLPTLHYYFPVAQLRGYREAEPASPDFEGRHFDAVLYPGLPIRLQRLP